MTTRSSSPTGSLSRQLRGLKLQDNMSTTGSSRPNVETKAKHALPDLYTGDRNRSRPWLNQLKLWFALNTGDYEKETKKVTFAATLLRGQAEQWFEPYLTNFLSSESNEDETNRLFGSFAYFEKKFKTSFSDIDEERAAVRDIQRLKQTGSAVKYTDQFNQLALRLDWDDAALTQMYYNGLKDFVKDWMMPNPPGKLDKMQEMSIQVDNRLYERRLEKGGRQDHSYYRSNTGRRYDSHHDPMDLSMAQHGRPQHTRKRGSTGRSSVPPKEKERRKKQNLCFNCGKSGHRARECNSSAQKLQMMSHGEAKKADTSQKTYENRGSSEVETAQVKDEQPEKTCEQKSWTICMSEDCQDHFAFKLENGWFPTEEPMTLAMMQAPNEEESASTESSEEEEEEDAMFQIYVADARQLLVRTNCWERKVCTGERCSQREAHEHVFVTERGIPPKEEIIGTVLRYCGDQRCACMTYKYIHQRDWELMEYELPERARQRMSEFPQYLYTVGPPGLEPHVNYDVVKFLAIRKSYHHLELKTKYWTSKFCQSPRCANLGTQHMHRIFTPQGDARQMVASVLMYFCRNEECACGTEHLVHQPTGELVECELPTHQYLPPVEQSLSMMMGGPERYSYVEPIIDDRQFKAALAEVYECGDTTCRLYHVPHKHLHNCDPDSRETPMTKEQAMSSYRKDGFCRDNTCPYEEYEHIHKSKN